jgi:hypothetical protein
MSDSSDATAEALERIARNGSDLGKPIEIDFFVAVPSRRAGDLVASHARDLGYRCSVECDSVTKRWTVYCSITMIATLAEVVRAEKQLDAIAVPVQGYCDGFGSYGNSDPTSRPS